LFCHEGLLTKASSTNLLPLFLRFPMHLIEDIASQAPVFSHFFSDFSERANPGASRHGTGASRPRKVSENVGSVRKTAWLRRGGSWGGRLFDTPRASALRDHLHATDTLIVCLLTRSIQRDALRSADGVHTHLPDAPEASYCSRGPDEPIQSLSRGPGTGRLEE